MLFALLSILFCLGVWPYPGKPSGTDGVGTAHLSSASHEILVRISACKDEKCQERQPLEKGNLDVYRADSEGFYERVESLAIGSAVPQLRLDSGAYLFLVGAPGFAERTVQRWIGGKSEVQMVIHPVRNYTLHIDGDHGPVRGATLRAYTDDALVYSVESDGKGAVLFDQLGAKPSRIELSAPGYQTLELRDPPDSGAHIRLERLRALALQVLDVHDQPAAGATVEITGPGLVPAVRSQSDSKGQVRITALQKGRYEIRAHRGALVSPTLWVSSELLGTQVLKMSVGYLIEVSVFSEGSDGLQPLEGAAVSGVEGGISPFPMLGKSGGEGKVVLGPFGENDITISARAEGFVPRVRRVLVAQRGTPQPEKLQLFRGGILSVHAEDERGQPLEGVALDVFGTDPDGLPIYETSWSTEARRATFDKQFSQQSQLLPIGELGVTVGPVPFFGGLGSADQETAWRTDISGEASLIAVSPGRLRVAGKRRGYVDASSATVNLSPGGRASVRLVMRPGRELEGRLSDRFGFPVGGARLSFSAVRGTFARHVYTSSDGSFALEGVPEKILVSVARPEDPTRIVLEEEHLLIGDPAELELILPDPRGEVRIRIEDDRGKEIDGAQISVRSLNADQPLRRTLFSRASGEVVLSDAEGLDLEVSAEAAGFARVKKRWNQASGELKLVLLPAFRLSGRIAGVRGRSAVEGAQLWIRVHGKNYSTVTDSSGEYVIEGIPPGNAFINVRARGHLFYHRRVQLKAERDELVLDEIVLTEAESIEGQVLDESEQPVSRARVAVNLVPSYFPAGELPPEVAISDEDGRFKLDVPRGKVKLSAYAVGQGRGSLVVDTQDNSEHLLVIHPGEEAPEPKLPGNLAVSLLEDAQGLAIAEIAPGSEAEDADLRVGDRLLRIDNRRPSDVFDARQLLSGNPGSDLLLELKRGGQVLKLRVIREAVRR